MATNKTCEFRLSRNQVTSRFTTLQRGLSQILATTAMQPCCLTFNVYLTSLIKSLLLFYTAHTPIRALHPLPTLALPPFSNVPYKNTHVLPLLDCLPTSSCTQ